MADFISDAIGGLDDRVVLRIYPTNLPSAGPDEVVVKGGKVVRVAEAWDWTSAVLEQPSHFSIQLGSGQTAAQILRSFTKGTKCELYINDCLQATGRLDGREAQGDAESGTSVTLHGRDVLSKVYDSHVDAVHTFPSTTTYASLTWSVLRHLNLVQGGAEVDPAQLAVSNDANRQTRYGNKVKKITGIGPTINANQIVSATDASGETSTVSHEIQCNIGERWLSFLRRYLDPAGLSLWAAANGTFVLSAPNAQQDPAYHLIRRQQTDRTLGNVKWFHLVDDATHQHTYVHVFGKGFGKKAGRVTSQGTAPNLELLNPINDPTWYQANAQGFGANVITYRELNCFTNEQCQNFAWRKMAEERRNGFQLHYRVAGHTLPIYGSSGQAVIVEDTVVRVDDEELDIHGNFYVDTVLRQRHPHTETTIRLCRQSDMVTSQPATAAKGAAPAASGSQAGFGTPTVINASEVVVAQYGESVLDRFNDTTTTSSPFAGASASGSLTAAYPPTFGDDFTEDDVDGS